MACVLECGLCSLGGRFSWLYMISRIQSVLIAVATIAASMTLGCQRNPPSVAPVASASDLARSARVYLERNDILRAEKNIREALLTAPKDPLVLEIAGDITSHSAEAESATEFYQAAIEQSETPSAGLFEKLGEQFMALGRPFEALQSLRENVAAHPSEAKGRELAVGMMTRLGLEREAAAHLKWLIQRGHGNASLLIIMSDLERPQTNVNVCERALQRYKDDLRPLYSLARIDAYRGKWQEVHDRLVKVTRRHPEFVPGQAYYIRALVELDKTDEIKRWLQNRPAKVETHPEYWISAGTWADRRGRTNQAAYAFARAVELDENNSQSLSSLAGLLKQLGRDAESSIVDQRVQKLFAARDAIDQYFALTKNSQTSIVALSRSLHSLGRPWEATVWLQVGAKLPGQPDPNLNGLLKTYRDGLTGKTPWQEPDQLVSARVDNTSLEKFAWLTGQSTQIHQETNSSIGSVRFVDRAASYNLEHFCRIDVPDSKQAGITIYQTGAGGIGVVDYDLDGQPDLYLTSSNGRPLQQDSATNQLYRNIGSNFVESTDEGAVNEKGFAQGVTVFDYNHDGFSDLYVSNIGQNRLFRNNGDGSFSEADEAFSSPLGEWTTSAAMADLNGDGLTDLFQVCYCAGNDPFTRVCLDKTGTETRPCIPVAFEAQQDRVFQGTQDGLFKDVTAEWLSKHSSGFGFGIVVGQLDDQPGLDVFVSNDTKGNHFWSRTQKDSFSFAETATVRGLAYNAQSIAQASMGVAAGDADRDGDIDFFVTNFTNDYHTFYEQVRPGIWSDRTTPLGLARPTFDLLGWGTQWLDADNDGVNELLVGNGHIDDLTDNGEAFRMPMQLIHRDESGKWKEVSKQQLGGVFVQPNLTRAVATVDVNRDGKLDAVATRLFDPVMVLVNESETKNQSVRLHLRSSIGDRNSIGAKVNYVLDGTKRTAQLLGGGGFQCSNENVVHIALGNQSSISKVTVLWPGGQIRSIGKLDAGKEYLIVDSEQDAFELPK